MTLSRKVTDRLWRALPRASEAEVAERRKGRGLWGVFLGIVALFWIAGPAGAAILIDDFETGGSPVAGMSVAQAGEGACDHLTGGSRALCGADTAKWAGPAGALLSYAVSWDGIAAVLFDLAARSDSDPFDHHVEEQRDDWGDYVRVTGVANGVPTLLAEFTGLMSGDRPSPWENNLVSTANGAALGPGIVADGTFGTVRLDLFGLPLSGAGWLHFAIRSTGSAEQIGLDEIRLAPAPLPGGFAALALGLGLLAAARARQRG